VNSTAFVIQNVLAPFRQQVHVSHVLKIWSISGIPVGNSFVISLNFFKISTCVTFIDQPNTQTYHQHGYEPHFTASDSWLSSQSINGLRVKIFKLSSFDDFVEIVLLLL
jgi:hypothetical protein